MKKSKAFTLVEVVIATTVTVVVVTSIFFLFTKSTILNIETKQKQIASRIGQSRIEELRNMSFADMTNASENVTISDLPNGHRITRIQASYGADIKQAEVEVDWTGKQGPMSVILDTLIYNQED